jgi:two-component system phosphate regulon sensor histidine kinase PhoR
LLGSERLLLQGCLFKKGTTFPLALFRVKKIFPIIIGLITLSLIGIIVIQLLWLKNMVLLRKEQIRHKITDATIAVGKDLEQRNANYFTHKNTDLGTLSPNDFLNYLRPNTIGQKYTASEIDSMIQLSFKSADLEDVKFEFGLAKLSAGVSVFERQSQNFFEEYADTVNNFSWNYYLSPPSGTEGENISDNELLIVVVPNYKHIVYESLTFPIISAILFTLIIITAFYLTVRTMLRQKKLSEIKNDFINNMTHEFKTPLATISLAVDALKNDKVINDVQKLTYFRNIIKEENLRMNRQVETILKAALLDKQEVQILMRPVHAHQVIKEVADNFALQLEDKHGKAILSLNAGNDYIDADEVHFSNLVNNLIDNAIKYSKDDQPPEITITTSSTPRSFVITMEDNGIGMGKETLKRIFEKFYRAHTGNIHNVKGFGLGLSYVKTMVEAHGGEIKVDSILGKGSTFIIELPLKKVQHQPAMSAVPA